MGKNALVSAATTLLTLALVLGWTLAEIRSNQEEEAVVRDIQGNPLEVGSEYLIKTVENGWYGPLIGRSAKPISVIPCPLYAIVSPNRDDAGQPVKFIPVDETDETQIHVSSPVQIDTGFSAYCRADGLWKLKFDPFSRSLVIVAGANGVPATTFNIELAPVVGPLRYAYKITVDGKGDVTVIDDFTSNSKLLGLFGQPLYVTFAKSPDPVYVAGNAVALE